MNKLNEFFKLLEIESEKLLTKFQLNLYSIILIKEGTGIIRVDDGEFHYQAPCLVFSSPFQVLKISGKKKNKLSVLQFHGDFYCIEFHKAEVACNGLLFNNVFLSPLVSLNKAQFRQINNTWAELSEEMNAMETDRSILIAYLQLILARASAIKRKEKNSEEIQDKQILAFKELIEAKFKDQHKPSYYAKALNVPLNTLSKKCTKVFGKTPSDLIHERIIVEAKRLLHLTRQSVKEIAFELQFKDEYYFSRFFKKKVHMSPVAFRKSVGISRVADLSMINPL